FHRHIVRSGNLEQRRRRSVVEVDFRISEIRQHQDVVLFRESDQVLVEIEGRNIRGRIGRIAHNHGGRLWNGMHDGAFKRVKEIWRRFRRNGTDGPTTHPKNEGMDGIARVRDENDVAGCGDGLRNIRKAFLWTEGGYDLRGRVQLSLGSAT